MQPSQFVRLLRDSVIEENLSTSKDLFQATDLQTVSDPYWSTALRFYRSLTEEDREVLFSIMRQTMVDTTSNILGILDGTCCTDPQPNGLALTAGDGERLDGDLQGLFLELGE